MNLILLLEEHLENLGHPDGPTVNLDRVSHKIVSLKESGSNFIGRAKILDTPMGSIASSLIKEGVKLRCFFSWYWFIKTNQRGI